MPKPTRWPETMWQEVLQWRKDGLTYAQVIERLEEPGSMRRFELKDVPSEATIRKELAERLKPGKAAPS
ncbi:MAG: hypothetical protein EXR67_04560 [Dehalococcoidia bacterium]|nr:hypothetical protein [Dehalococcoidia bacterium]